MRRSAHLLTAAIVVLTLLMSACTSRVTFPDQGLLHAVAGAAGVAPESLTLRDVRKLTDLDAVGYGITSLEGIESLQALTTLALDDNSLVDLQPLVDAKIAALAAVSLTGNPLPVNLDSQVYQQVATLTAKGIKVAWLPTFITPVGGQGILREIEQAADGAILAIGDGSLIRVTVEGPVSEVYECPWYPRLRNIVRSDGLILSNNAPSAQTAPWEYSFEIQQGFTSRRLLEYPSGDYRMFELDDSDLLLVGSPYDKSGGSQSSALVARLRPDRSEVWSVVFDGLGGGRSAVNLDGGFAVLCDRGVAELSATGVVVQTADFPADYGYQVRWLDRIVETDDGCMVLGAPDIEGVVAVVLTYSSDLALVGNATISFDGDSSRAMMFGFVRTDDGGLVITLHNRAYPEEQPGGRLLRLDQSGTVVWSQSYDDYALDAVIQTADGGFAVTGRDERLITHIIKTDANGLVAGRGSGLR